MAEWWCDGLPTHNDYGAWCVGTYPEAAWLIPLVVGIAYAVIAVGWKFYGPKLTEWDRKVKRHMNRNMTQNDEAVSPVVGVILMVAITVVLAAIVFILVQSLGKGVNTDRPDMAISAVNTTVLQVAQAPTGLDWSAFTITGCTTLPTGAVDAGDRITGCGITVTIRHNPSNSLVYSR